MISYSHFNIATIGRSAKIENNSAYSHNCSLLLLHKTANDLSRPQKLDLLYVLAAHSCPKSPVSSLISVACFLSDKTVSSKSCWNQQRRHVHGRRVKTAKQTVCILIRVLRHVTSWVASKWMSSVDSCQSFRLDTNARHRQRFTVHLLIITWCRLAIAEISQHANEFEVG